MMSYPRVYEYPPVWPWTYPRLRLEFISEAEALAHQRRVSCGGWVVGRNLFPGVSWHPEAIAGIFRRDDGKITRQEPRQLELPLGPEEG